MRSYFHEFSAANDVSETASATICMFNMGNWKSFDVTIRCCAAEGMQFNIYGSPCGDSSVQILVTGATAVTDFGAAAGTVRSTIRENNLNTFWIEGAATAAGREVSSSELRIFVTAFSDGS